MYVSKSFESLGRDDETNGDMVRALVLSASNAKGGKLSPKLSTVPASPRRAWCDVLLRNALFCSSNLRAKNVALLAVIGVLGVLNPVSPGGVVGGTKASDLLSFNDLILVAVGVPRGGKLIGGRREMC